MPGHPGVLCGATWGRRRPRSARSLSELTRGRAVVTYNATTIRKQGRPDADEDIPRTPPTYSHAVSRHAGSHFALLQSSIPGQSRRAVWSRNPVMFRVASTAYNTGKYVRACRPVWNPRACGQALSRAMGHTESVFSHEIEHDDWFDVLVPPPPPGTDGWLGAESDAAMVPHCNFGIRQQASKRGKYGVHPPHMARDDHAGWAHLED